MLVRRLRHSWRTRAHKGVLESEPELGAGGYVGGDQLLGGRPGLVDFDREADPDVGALGGRTTEGPQRGDDGVDQRWSGSPWRRGRVPKRFEHYELKDEFDILSKWACHTRTMTNTPVAVPSGTVAPKE